MARIDIGNPLTETKLTFGWKVSDDGFGLRTCQAVYNLDNEQGMDYIRGEAFPVTGYDYLKLHRQTSVFGKGGIQVQTCDYVGIDPEVNGGEFTNPQVGSSNGLTSENLTSHPNFFSVADGFDVPIAGSPPYSPAPIGPVVSHMDGGAKKPRQSFIGENGACFETPDGGRFIGFMDPEVPSLFGKTNYLSATTTFSGQVYVLKTSAKIAAFKTCLGKTSRTRNFEGQLMDIIPAYLGTTFQGPIYDQLLLSQVNFEDYAELVKVSFEIRFSKEGWDSKVYSHAEA